MTKIYKIESPSVLLGRSSICDIYFPEEDMISTRHAVITRDRQDELLMQGKNGGYVNGRFVSMGERVKIEYADEIRIPHITIIWLHDETIVLKSGDGICSRLSEVELDATNLDFDNVKLLDGDVDSEKKSDLIGEKRDITNPRNEEIRFSPSPKTHLEIDISPVELEAPPEKREQEVQGTLMTIGPAFTMSIPMMLGVLITFVGGKSQGAGANNFMYMGLITAVSSAFLGGIWAMLNLKNRTRSIELSEIRRREAYERYVKNAENLIYEKYIKNRNALNAMNPIIQDKLNGQFRNSFIFARKKSDDDYLSVRIGSGNIKYEAQVIIPKTRFSVVSDDLKILPKTLKQKYDYLSDVPICININKQNPVGIISDDISKLRELFNLMILSIASEHSPMDVRIGLYITNNEFRNLIDDFLLFLPHIFTDDDKALITRDNIGSFVGNKESDNKNLVIITDSYESIKRTVDMSFKEDVDSANAYKKADSFPKVHFIVTAKSFVDLPDECMAIIQRERQFNGIIYINESDHEKKRQELYFDVLKHDEYRKGICLLAGLSRYVKSSKTSIPKSVAFLSMGLDTTNILRKWKDNSTIDEIKIPIGKDTKDSVQYLDFHQSRDGPHGLIAGMTGSGKSEMLQTIILALALKYHPDEVAFFLIDYKGGGMAELFGGIPHLMGSISNLSGKLVNRAMISIRSENERRQIIFNDAGVNNIYDYTKLYRSGRVQTALPHIFIVIDEFAELKKEMPDFMQEIISIARVGRSLGLHLLLATQKPSGTVDENIRSNSRFAICLKVSDRTDSMEVIKTDEAAYISNPGRAILRVGNNEIYKEFQGAYTMAPANDNRKKKKGVYFFNDYGEIIEDDIIRTDENDVSHVQNDIVTDDRSFESELSISVAAVIKAGEEGNVNNFGKLWKPPLPEIIVPEDDSKEINILMYDDLRHQTYGIISYDIFIHGHLLILGFIQSGKSTFLQNISCEIIKKFDSSDFNLYFIDFSSHKLMPFKNSNMCGGYFYDENASDIEKLFLMMSEIIKERKRILVGTTFKQYVNKERKIPAIIIFIDGFSAFREHTNGQFDEEIINILKNGEILGVYIISTAASISSNEFPNRMFECVKTVFPLTLADKFLYAQALKSSADKIFQINDNPGRGLCKLNDNILEFQAFIPVDTNDDYLLMSYCNDLVERMNDAKKSRAAAVPVIPKNPVVTDLKKCVEQDMHLIEPGTEDECDSTDSFANTKTLDSNKTCIPIGYEERSGKVYYLPLTKNRNVIVSGQSEREKKDVLLVLDEMCQFMGVQIRADSSYSFENRVISYDGSDWIIGVHSDRLDIGETTDFNKKMGEDPYVIHIGGALDRCRVADFSYLPYMKQTEIKKPYHGTVHKFAEDEFSGDIVIARPQ